MKVRLTRPELVDRTLDEGSGPGERCLTSWRGEFEGAPGRWWREAFAMWAGELLQGACDFQITATGYEFECGEDQIDDVMEKLVAAARRAGPTGDRTRAKEKRHEDTRRLFAQVEDIKRKMLAQADAAGEDAERRKLQERMARRFEGLEQ